MENLTQLADQELVSMYREGNDRAFDALLEHNQKRVMGYITFMVGGDTHEADDVFQDTFIKAIMAIRDNRYQENGQFGAWLLRVARNVIIDRQRARKPERNVNTKITGKDGEVMGDLLSYQSMAEPNAEMAMVNTQSAEELRYMVESLPQPQREVVALRFFDELSFREIADITGVSINTALGRMRYALINLRRMATDRDLYMAV